MDNYDLMEIGIPEEEEGARGEIPTCGTCYLFGECSSKNPGQRADNCYVRIGELEACLV